MNESRIQTSIPVDFQAGTLRGSGKIQNVSEHGLFVRTGDLPDEGDAVYLQFAPPGERRIRIRGVVWWTTRDASAPAQAQRSSGFGLRLIEQSASYDRAISRLTR